MNVITVSGEMGCEKPPEYETVASLMPPSYDDAIKLNPSLFLCAPAAVASSASTSSSSSSSAVVHLPAEDNAEDNSKEESSSTTVHHSRNSRSRRSISTGNAPTSPPVYTITTVMPNEVVTYDNERASVSR